jgi:hypothetical protein
MWLTEKRDSCTYIDTMFAKIGGGIAGVWLQHAWLRAGLDQEHMAPANESLSENLP